MSHRLASVAAILLAGCVAQGTFPSLAVRPAELEDMSVEPVRPEPIVADDPGLAERVAGLAGEARAGWRAFETAAGSAERAAASSGPIGSDSWLVAQQAISRLEAARGQTMAARAELEELALARQNQPTSPGDRRSIDAAIAEAEAIAERQQNRLERIRRD